MAPWPGCVTSSNSTLFALVLLGPLMKPDSRKMGTLIFKGRLGVLGPCII